MSAGMWRRLTGGWRLALGLLLLSPGAPAAAQPLRDRPPEDEILCHLLPERFETGDPGDDRGGIRGGRLDHGFDPADARVFHGGDSGRLARWLAYLKRPGVTAILIGPVPANTPVAGPPGGESAGYRGRWIRNFTRPDPHPGTAAGLEALVAAAHAQGIKVCLDILASHTADIIGDRECPANDCPYRILAHDPWTRRLEDLGHPTNGRLFATWPAHQTAGNVAELTDPTDACSPFVLPGRERARAEASLNDRIWYHNRGTATAHGEGALRGDIDGLDDLVRSHPLVAAGMIDIFGALVDRTGIDGFRVLGANRANPEFRQAFVPAMRAQAQARGIPHFHICGGAPEPVPGIHAGCTRRDGLAAMRDAAFPAAVVEVVAAGAPPARLARPFAQDVACEGGEAAALAMPTFRGEDKRGRLSFLVRADNRAASPEAQLARVKFPHAMLRLRGVPALCFGDEQGFVGKGAGNERQPLMPSRVLSDSTTPLHGTAATAEEANRDTDHPLCRRIAALAALRAEDPALCLGLQRVRAAEPDGPGLFAVARREPGGNRAPFIATVVAFNTSGLPLRANIPIDPRIEVTACRLGTGAQPSVPGRLAIEIPPLEGIVCGGAVAVR